MQIAFRPNHRYYQRLRAEHIAREASLSAAAPAENEPTREVTLQQRQRAASEQLLERYGTLLGRRSEIADAVWALVRARRAHRRVGNVP